MIRPALVTGAGGQLGRDLVVAFGEAPGSRPVVPADHARLDVADRDAVLQLVDAAGPEVIVHAGAWTAVDACEGDTDRAYRVNALGSRHVAEAARLLPELDLPEPVVLPLERFHEGLELYRGGEALKVVFTP